MMYAGERILLTLWIGSLLAIGYIAVPLLFASLDDRMLAGMLAGKMFSVVSLLGLVAGGLLLLIELLRSRTLRHWRPLVLVAMLVLVAVGEFFLQPMMADLKTQGIAEGTRQATEFARLHGISSVLYLITTGLGLALVTLIDGRTKAV